LWNPDGAIASLSYPAMTTRFDIAVVGAGSAGCALAARLSERPDLRVALIEAGGRSDHIMLRVPVTWPAASEQPRFGWRYGSEPEPGTMNRVLSQPRGRLLGGTSSINGMMYSRGHPSDYDGWAADGLQGWSHADVLPYFKRSETNWRGEGPYHGGAGPVSVSRNPRDPLIYPVMIETARVLGYEENDDFNGARQSGFGMPDFTVRRGSRESSWTAYLSKSRRPNLTVISNAVVTSVLHDGGRCLGVAYRRDGVDEVIHAGETVLSSGAFNSPHLLMLSGIGDPEDLRRAGVTPRHALPAVGRNLQDHPLIANVYKAARPLAFERLMRADRLAASGLRWLLGRGGALGDAPLSVQSYINLSGTSEIPDTQFQVSHVSFEARPWFPGWRAGAGDAFTVSAMQLRPRGCGDVTLRSNDPFDTPAIRLGLLANETDRQAARDMLAFSRRFFRQQPLADLVSEEVFPPPAVAGPQAVDAHLAATIQTGMHPVGSCAMGIDPVASVVDADLRVHGIANLRIADASIMPRIIGGNTSAPAMMIGEKAADLILGDSPTDHGVLLPKESFA